MLKGKSVAKKVSMQPLANLDRRAPRIIREVGIMLYHKMQDLLEFMHEVEVQTNDLIKSRCLFVLYGIKKGVAQPKKID